MLIHHQGWGTHLNSSKGKLLVPGSQGILLVVTKSSSLLRSHVSSGSLVGRGIKRATGVVNDCPYHVPRLADAKLKQQGQRCALERWSLQVSFASASTADSLNRNPPLNKAGQHNSLEAVSPRMEVHFQMRASGL